ncbi:hypothetical protein [uncultured Bradyrhizobium sp.]|uniref:hypothetical protein n=1 Tax=uncultured Bradyrhizobium sp. TaxID=199684 RepID=UPI0035CBF71D
MRKAAFARCCKNGSQPGIPQCENCGNILRSGNIEYEHLDPDGLGGEPTLENCGVWCAVPCSSKKTREQDIPRMAKADAVLKASFGLKAEGRPMPGSRRSGFRKRMNGQVERRT